MSDCSTVFGFTSCKELTIDGPLTCQATATCLATNGCFNGEYCTSSDSCLAAGWLGRLNIHLRIIWNFQCIAYPTLTVSHLLEQLFARKLSMVELKPAKLQHLALNNALLKSFVMQQILAHMVNFKWTIISILRSFYSQWFVLLHLTVLWLLALNLARNLHLVVLWLVRLHPHVVPQAHVPKGHIVTQLMCVGPQVNYVKWNFTV